MSDIYFDDDSNMRFPDANGKTSTLEICSHYDEPVLSISYADTYDVQMTRDQVAAILPALQAFVEHGKLK